MGSFCSRLNIAEHDTNVRAPFLDIADIDANVSAPYPNHEKIGVFWDMENCNVKSGFSLLKAIVNMRTALRESLNDTPILEFCIYCGADDVFSELQRQTLWDTGIDLHCVGNKDKHMMVGMFEFALRFPPPSYIMLISGDGDFTDTLEALRVLGYTVILVIPEYYKKVSDDLKNSSDFVCSWSSLFQGDGFVDASGASSSSSHNLSLRIVRTAAQFSQARCDTGIFWGMKACPVPSGMLYENAVTYILSFIKNRCPSNDGMEPAFNAYGGKYIKIPEESRIRCEDLGLKFIDSKTRAKKHAIDKKILLDLLVFAYKNRACNIMVISGDEDLAPVFFRLANWMCKVTVVVPSKSGIWGSTCYDENFLFEWPDLVEKIAQSEDERS